MKSPRTQQQEKPIYGNNGIILKFNLLVNLGQINWNNIKYILFTEGSNYY